jgi:hypothetical protein
MLIFSVEFAPSTAVFQVPLIFRLYRSPMPTVRITFLKTQLARQRIDGYIRGYVSQLIFTKAQKLLDNSLNTKCTCLEITYI